MSEQTLFIIKPDAVTRKLIGSVVSEIEKSGLKIRALTMKTLTKEEAQALYQEHQEQPFFLELMEQITRSPIICGVCEGDTAISQLRALIGDTDPSKAAKNSLRSKFGLSKGENTIHGSDSLASAKREIQILFPTTKF